MTELVDVFVVPEVGPAQQQWEQVVASAPARALLLSSSSAFATRQDAELEDSLTHLEEA